MKQILESALFVLIVAALATLGIGIGLGLTNVSSRSHRAGLVRPANAPRASKWWTRLDGVKARGSGPNTLDLTRTLMLGSPASQPRNLCLHAVVTEPDGTVAVDEELDRRTILPGRGDFSKSFARRFWIPEGTYTVRVFAHDPGRTPTHQGVQDVLAIDSESVRYNVIVP